MIPEYAARYGNLEQWHWWFRGRQRILADVLERELPAGRTRSLCVVGCGPAEGLDWLRPFAGPGGWVIGVDPDPTHARALQSGVQVVVGRMEAIPLAAGAVDAVLAFDVLEHVDDDGAALREVRRLIKPGGLLAVTVPAMPSLWGAQDVVNRHMRRYTRATLRAAFARADLPPPRTSYFNSLLLPMVAAVRWTRRLLGKAEEARTDFDDNRPGALNDALMHVFAAERDLLRRTALPIGVSLLATLRTPR
jgi:SAM-dependent methyltransferase